MSDGQRKGVVQPNAAKLSLTADLALILEIIVTCIDIKAQGVTLELGVVRPRVFLSGEPVFGVEPPFEALKAVFVVL